MLGCCDPTIRPDDPLPSSDERECIDRLLRFEHRVDATRFQKGDFLANGAQAVVYKATLDGQPVAAKQLHVLASASTYSIRGPTHVGALYRQGAELALAVRELEVLARLPRHENVIGFLGVIVDILQGVPVPMFMLMELMPDGNLEQLLKDEREEMNDARAVQVIIGVLEGLKHLHQQEPPLVHRDIKPKNILVDRATSSVKIADFGFTRPAGRSQFRFTPTYMPPWATRVESTVTTKMDIFAAGVTFFEMLGNDPEGGQTPAYRRHALNIANRLGERGVKLFSCLGETPEACPEAVEVLNVLRGSVPPAAPARSGPVNTAPAEAQPLGGTQSSMQELPWIGRSKSRAPVAMFVLVVTLVTCISPFVLASGGDCEARRRFLKQVSPAIRVESAFLFDHICFCVAEVHTALLLLYFLFSIRRGPLWVPGLPRRFMWSVLLYFILSLGLHITLTMLSALRDCFAGTKLSIEACELCKLLGSPARALVLGFTTTARLEALQLNDTWILYRLLCIMADVLAFALLTHICLRSSGVVSDYFDNFRFWFGVAAVLAVLFSLFTAKAITVYWRTWKWVTRYANEHAPPDEIMLLDRCRARVLRSLQATALSLTSTLGLWAFWIVFRRNLLGGAHSMRAVYSAECLVNDVCVCFMAEFWNRAVRPLTDDFEAASRAARRHESQLLYRERVAADVQAQLRGVVDFLRMLQADSSLRTRVEHMLHVLSHLSWRSVLQYQWSEDQTGASLRWDLWKKLVEHQPAQEEGDASRMPALSSNAERSDPSLDQSIAMFNEATWPVEVGLPRREWPLRLRNTPGGITRLGELDDAEAETLSAGDPYELLAFETFLRQKWGSFQRFADPSHPSAEAFRGGRPTPAVRIRFGERYRPVQLLLRDHGEIWRLARRLVRLEQAAATQGISIGL